jgi:hypothetical protein
MAGLRNRGITSMLIAALLHVSPKGSNPLSGGYRDSIGHSDRVRLEK